MTYKKLTVKDITRHTKALTDGSIMPFGKHQGEKLASVPASYLIWFYEQDWAEEKYPALYNYCKEYEEALYTDYHEGAGPDMGDGYDEWK